MSLFLIFFVLTACTNSNSAPPNTSEILPTTETSQPPRITIPFSYNKVERVRVASIPKICNVDGSQFFCPDIFSIRTNSPYTESACEIDGLNTVWGVTYELTIQVKGRDTRADGSGCGPSLRLLSIDSETAESSQRSYPVSSFATATEDSIFGTEVIWDEGALRNALEAKGRNAGGILTLTTIDESIEILSVSI